MHSRSAGTALGAGWLKLCSSMLSAAVGPLWSTPPAGARRASDNRRNAMTYGRQNVGNWLKHPRAMSKRYQDPGLSALLVAQLVLVFVAEPLDSEGVAPPLTATG